MAAKQYFKNQLKGFVEELQEHITTKDGQWTVKGFIDVYRNVYTISSDTKIVFKNPRNTSVPKDFGVRQSAWLQGSIG